MEFKAKDWVLVRDGEKEKWKLDIFSHFVDGNLFPYICIGSYYSECIPFEGNEALLGTTDAPEEKHVWHAGDHVDVLSDFDDMWHPGSIVEIDYTRSGAGFSYRVESECFKSINSTGKVWCKADQLREPEEKNADEDWNVGDIVEVKNERDGCWYPGKILLIKKGTMPYFVQSEFGFKEISNLTRCSWCSKDQLRNLGETPEEKEEFRFGDWVEVLEDGEWTVGIVTEVDEDDEFATYHVYFPDNDGWYGKSKVRRHEGKG